MATERSRLFLCDTAALTCLSWQASQLHAAPAPLQHSPLSPPRRQWPQGAFQSHRQGPERCHSLLTLFRHLNVPLSRQGSLYVSFFTVEKNSISPQTHRQGKFLGHLQFAAETTVQPVNKATSTRCPGPTPTLYAPCLETRFKSC